MEILMDAVDVSVTKFAPLAFSLSIHTENAEASLITNAFDPVHSLLFSVACAGAVGAVAACGLCLLLPTWLSVPIAISVGYKSFKPFRRYFDNDYPTSRVLANRELLALIIDEEDLDRFAEVAQSVVHSQYGRRNWAIRANELLRAANPDPLKYQATLFTFAPECWRKCARSVYAST